MQEGVRHCSVYFGEIETSDLSRDVPEARPSRSQQGKLQRCLRSAQDSGPAGWPSHKPPRGVCAPELPLKAHPTPHLHSLQGPGVHLPPPSPAAGPRGIWFSPPTLGPHCPSQACPFFAAAVRHQCSWYSANSTSHFWKCFSKQLISSQSEVTFSFSFQFFPFTKKKN